MFFPYLLFSKNITEIIYPIPNFRTIKIKILLILNDSKCDIMNDIYFLMSMLPKENLV